MEGSMLKAVKECVLWLNWKVVGVAALVVVGLILCTELPALSILAGATPLLLVVACLVPCLLPLALLHRKSRDRGTVQPSEQAADSCGCGQGACHIGAGPNACKSQNEPIESARS